MTEATYSCHRVMKNGKRTKRPWATFSAEFARFKLIQSWEDLTEIDPYYSPGDEYEFFTERLRTGSYKEGLAKIESLTDDEVADMYSCILSWDIIGDGQSWELVKEQL